jgi:hypothetical protein
MKRIGENISEKLDYTPGVVAGFKDMAVVHEPV